MTENAEQVESSVDDTDQELAGIDGWLLLVALGFILGPIVAVYYLAVSVSVYFKAGCEGIYIIEPIASIGLLCFFLYTATLFFRRKSSLPGTFITFIIVGTAIRGLLLLFQLGAEAEFFEGKAGLWVAKEILRAAIWISYFRVSKRVKATFVN